MAVLEYFVHIIAMPVIDNNKSDDDNLVNDRAIIRSEIGEPFKPGWTNSKNAEFENHLKDPNPAPGAPPRPMFFVFIEYKDIDDLVAKAKKAIPDEKITQTSAGPDGYTYRLKILQIHMHASPRGIDDLSDGDYVKLKDIDKWDDTVTIILAGCNTGTTDKDNGCTDSLAKRVARELRYKNMPANPGPFRSLLKVWGTLGFLRELRSDIVWDTQNLQTLVVASPPKNPLDKNDTQKWPPYGGSKDAKGADAWVQVPNDQP